MKRRVLHVAPYGPDAWAYGGIPRVVAGMTRGLAERGHDVMLCVTDAQDGRSRLDRSPRATGVERRSAADVRIDRRVFPNVSNWAAYHLQAFAPIGLRRFLDREAASFDLAHLHACHNLPVIMAADALGRAGVPWVISPNGTAPIHERRFLLKRSFDRLLGTRPLRDASLVLAVSQAEQHQLETLGVERSRIAQLPNPVDFQEVVDETDAVFADDRPATRQVRDLPEGPLIAFVGKITPRKHVDVLVEALATLPGDRTQLVVAGNDLGGLAQAMERARALGLVDRVHSVGLLRGADRLRLMSAADVVVYPSRDEVFGLVAVEALSAGTPVIVGSDSGCGEMIASIGGGIGVDPGRIEPLADALRAVLGHRERWRQEASRAALVARQQFAVPVVAARLERIYESALSPRAERIPA